MFRVLVVDDEPRQRRILSNVIREFREEYEVLEAKNGEEALTLSMNRNIDIVFSDIRMPKMDGLSMIERISEHNPFVKIVIVSGYSDFSYAQKALDLHVYQYILKPIEEKKIWDIILQIEEDIRENSIRQKEKEVMIEQLNMLLPFYIEHLLNKWVKGEGTLAELNEVAGIFPFWGTGCVILSQILNDRETPYNHDEMNEIRWNIKIWMKEALERYGYSISFFMQRNSYVMASILTFTMHEDYKNHSMLKSIQELVNNLHKEYGITMTVGVGKVQDDIFSSVKTGFETAEMALNCQFYLGQGQVIDYEDIQLRCSQELSGCFKPENELKQVINGQKPLNRIWIDQGLKNLLGESYLNPDLLLDYISQLMLRLLYSIQNIVSDEDFSGILQKIRRYFLPINCINLEQMKELMIELLVDMACAVQNRKNNKINIIMEQCLQDIQCNFAWISLEHLANKYYFNSSYFSTLFKKYTGKHFTNYIMDIRLEKAYRLLLETDKKIYRISKLVGYKDVKYFNKLFKRRYGLTPDECRKFSKSKVLSI